MDEPQHTDDGEVLRQTAKRDATMSPAQKAMLADEPAIRESAARMQLARTLLLLHPPALSAPAGRQGLGAAPDAPTADGAFRVAEATIARALHDQVFGTSAGGAARGPQEAGSSPSGLPPGIDDGVYRPDEQNAGATLDVLRRPATPGDQPVLPAADFSESLGYGLSDDIGASLLPAGDLGSLPHPLGGARLEPIAFIRSTDNPLSDATSPFALPQSAQDWSPYDAGGSGQSSAHAARPLAGGTNSPPSGVPAGPHARLEPPKVEVTLIDVRQLAETAFHEHAAQVTATVNQRIGSELSKAAAMRQAHRRAIN